MMFRRNFLLVASALIVAGCSLDANSSRSLEIPLPTAEVLQLQLPFDAYKLSLSELHTTYEASDVLIRSCLRKKGYGWDKIEIPKKVPDWTARLRYGPIEDEVARMFGYHSPAKLLESPQVRDVISGMNERESGLGQKEVKSVMDCREKANKELTRNAKAKFAQFEDLKLKAHGAALQTPEVRQKMAAWSACMKESGYSYNTPKDAYSKWTERDVKEPSKIEVSTARVDVECKHETKLVRVWLLAEKVEEEKQERKHGAYLRKLKEANRKYLENARRVISESRQ